MAYTVKVAGRPVGESFDVPAGGSSTTTYRPFLVEGADVKDEGLKKELEGSYVLAYPVTGPWKELGPDQRFALLKGIKEEDGSFPSLVLCGTIYDCHRGDRKRNVYKLLEVEDVEIIGGKKRISAVPNIAPIDYDETVELGKKEKTEPEYRGNGAGFEL